VLEGDPEDPIKTQAARVSYVRFLASKVLAASRGAWSFSEDGGERGRTVGTQRQLLQESV